MKTSLKYISRGQSAWRELLLFTIYCLCICAPTSGQKTFKASFAKTSITPNNSQTLIGYAPRKSEGVRDSLYHKVLILDDGENQFYLISSDLAAIAPPTFDRFFNIAKSKFNIDREHVWWTNTHTHSAPEVGSPGVIRLFLGERYEAKYDEEYTTLVIDQLVSAIEIARKKLTPAKIGFSWGYSRANINRRGRSIDNKTFLGENPDAPVDRKIGLIRVEYSDGKLLALVANYPIHGTVLSSSDLRISGDVPSEVANYVEEELGAPLLFINGALGNIAPRFSVSVSNGGNKDFQLRQFRRLLGVPIIEANHHVKATTGNIKLHTSSIWVETPKRNDIKGWPDDMSTYIRKSQSGVEYIRMPIQFLKINDECVFWGAPCELFCEISNAIRETSPFPYTFYAGITNGTFGYLCTAKEFELGGYEPTVSPFTPGAELDLIREVNEHLDALSKKK